MFVKPKDGRSVPDPARGDLLPKNGRNVEETSYWLRREADGDVERTKNVEKTKVKTDDN